MGKNPYSLPDSSAGIKRGTAKGARVLLALSGGGGSAAAAILLQEQGYQVEGIYFDFSQKFREARPEFECLRDHRAHAEEVAKELGVPLAIVQSDGFFQQKVISPLQENAAQGLLFDPCSSCHSRFYLEVLYQEARDRGIENIATGHYIRISREPELGTCVWRAKDQARDQSFLISRTRPLILKSLLAPLGHMKTADVDKLLEHRNLKTAASSTHGYCVTQRNFFAKYVHERASSLFGQRIYLVSPDLRAISEMEGGEQQFYWGQSEGLEKVRETAVQKGFLAAKHYVVTGVDVSKHYVFMGAPSLLRSAEVLLENVHWIVYPDLRTPKRVTFVSRNQKIEEVLVELLMDNFVRLRALKEGDYFELAPGDLGVLYDKDLCLGSGEHHGKY
jgi:tRNA-uridine 2-sulfurtransferase